MQAPNPIWPIPGLRWFNDRQLKHNAPVLFWLTLAAVAVFMFLRWWRYLIWAAGIGWFFLPLLAKAYEYWSWKRGLRLSRKKKARELLRAAQERFGLTGR
jgi:hypothetical protein